MSRPLLPRASSATSLFFFWGNIDDPVGEVVAQRGKVELGRGPEHQLLAHAREMNSEQRDVKE